MRLLPVLVAALASFLYSGARDGRLPLPCLLPVVDVAPSKLPRPSPLRGLYAPNTALRAATRLFFEGRVQGAESVAVAPGGASLLMLDKFGSVLRARATGPTNDSGGGGGGDSSGGGAAGGFELEAQPVAWVGPGRPLGAHLSADGSHLIICDSLKGLLSLDLGSGQLTILANAVSPGSGLAPGSPVAYANDLDVAADGTVYFSDCSAIPPALGRGGWYDTLHSYMLSMWQGGATGRLLAYNPRSRETTVVAEGFWYANGVALSGDESYVVLAETVSMTLHKIWLAGPKAGTTEVLLTGLPGFPDGVSRAAPRPGEAGDSFWVSLVVPDMPLARAALPHRDLRWALAWLPAWALPATPQWGAVVRVSGEGEVLQFLMDPDGSHVSHVSAVTEREGRLYLGNLAKDYVSVLQLPVEAAGAEAEVAAAGAEAAGRS